MKAFTRRLGPAWVDFDAIGHPVEIGHAFGQQRLGGLLKAFNETLRHEPLPYLGALVACSAFDIALHDAFGLLHGVATYDTYNGKFMNADLSAYLVDASGGSSRFACSKIRWSWEMS